MIPSFDTLYVDLIKLLKYLVAFFNTSAASGDWLVSIDDQDVDFTCIDQILASVTSPTQVCSVPIISQYLNKMFLKIINYDMTFVCFKVVVTFQKVVTQTRHSLFLEHNDAMSSESNALVQLVSGERLKKEPMSLQDVPHGLLYLTLDCQSDSMQDKVRHAPRTSLRWCSS